MTISDRNMTRSDVLIENYRGTYFKCKGKFPELRRRGNWIYINKSPTAHRISKLEVYTKNLEAEYETLMLAKFQKEPVDTPEDIRALVSAIRQDGRNIYHKKITKGSDIKQVKEAGRRISKMAKRILNILDEE